MLRELYTRGPSDPLYYPGILEQSDEIETLLGQIRMIMFTKQGDVLGSYTFGYNLEDNLFLFDTPQGQLQSALRESIYTYCPDASTYNVEVQIQFFKGSVRDVCLIDITIDGEKRLGILVK